MTHKFVYTYIQINLSTSTYVQITRRLFAFQSVSCKIQFLFIIFIVTCRAFYFSSFFKMISFVWKMFLSLSSLVSKRKTQSASSVPFLNSSLTFSHSGCISTISSFSFPTLFFISVTQFYGLCPVYLFPPYRLYTNVYLYPQFII